MLYVVHRNYPIVKEKYQMISQNDVITTLNDYLDSQTTFTLATHSEDGPWISNMFFGYIEGKLFFSSKLKTKHAKDIGSGSKVAFAIADSSQTPASKIIGLQGVGYCRLSSLEDAPSIIKHLGLRFAEYNSTFGNLAALKEVLQGGVSSPFTIEISMIKFLHKEKFGGYQIIEFSHGKISRVYPG